LAELKRSLQRSETFLAVTATNADDLGKQLDQRNKTIEQANEDLKQKQQLDFVLAEAQAETFRRSAAEQSIQELNTQAGGLTEHYTGLDAMASEQKKQLAKSATQIASLQGELDASKLYAVELNEQLARVTAEATDLRSSSEQEGRYRSSLEAELRIEQEQIGHLSNKMAELQREDAQLEIRLEEERRSAAKGVELLMMAQEKMAGVFQRVGSDAQTANGGDGSMAPPEVDGDMPCERRCDAIGGVIPNQLDAFSA
jgi:chromosome segregation ATPase